MSPRLCFHVLQDRFGDQLGRGLAGSTQPAHSRQAEKSLVKGLLLRSGVGERENHSGYYRSPGSPTPGWR